MAAGQCQVTVGDDALLVILIEEKSPHSILPLPLRNQRHHLTKLLIAFYERCPLLCRSVLYRERTDSYGIMLAKDIECPDTVVLHMLCLRDEKRVVMEMILSDPSLETVVIKIRRYEVERRSCRMPYIYQMGKRAGRRVFARLASAAVHGRVDVKRDIIDLTSRLCHALYVSCIMPGHEDLVSIYSLSEHISPCTFGLRTVCLPLFLHVRMEFLLMLAKERSQFLRHRSIETSVRFLRMVTGILKHADLILDLYHDYRTMILVSFSDMAEPGLESPVVGLEHILRKGTCNLQRLAFLGICPRILLEILLEP